MVLKDLLDLTIEASKGKNDFSKGIIGINGYGFLFRELKYLEKFFDLGYSSGLYYLGSTCDLLKSRKKIEEQYDFLRFYSERVDDLCYVGIIKTLVPSLIIGEDDLLFEVGLIIKTPYGKLFPATLHWRKGVIVLGGMKKELFYDFQGFKDLELVDIDFMDDEIEELVEALMLTLQKVPISDFEAIYFSDEFGAMRMGIDSGVPYMEDIEEEVDEDVFHNNTIMGNEATQNYYYKFEEIMKNCINPEDMEEYNRESKRLIKMGRSKEERMTFHRKFNGRLINRCFNELIQYVNKFNSRFAFHALGVIILEYGAKMTDDIKTLILKNSRWRDERYKFKEKNARIERRKYLFEFIARILEYKEGEINSIPWVPEDN